MKSKHRHAGKKKRKKKVREGTAQTRTVKDIVPISGLHHVVEDTRVLVMSVCGSHPYVNQKEKRQR